MDSHSSSLSFEVRIIRARNIYLKSSKDLFIRCYLPAGNNQKVRLNSQQIPSNSNLIWNQTFSLDCSGNEETIKSLHKEAIIFELRCRNSTPFIGRVGGSKLLAKAEMPWGDVVEAPNMEIEKWVVMVSDNGHVYGHDAKPPAVQIAVKVEESGRKKDWGRWDNCGCMERGCNSCVDYEFFALEAVLEAF